MIVTFILPHLSLLYNLIKYTIACRNLGLILSFLFCFNLTSQAQLTAQWATMPGGPNNDYGKSVAVDDLGNMYVTGITKNDTILDFGNGVVFKKSHAYYSYVVKYNATGAAQWFRSAGEESIGHDIAVDQAGNVYTSGTFNKPIVNFGDGVSIQHSGDGDYDIFLVKYDTQGTALWAKSINGLSGGDPRSDQASTSIVVDHDGNAYLAGTFKDQVFDSGTLEQYHTLTNIGASQVRLRASSYNKKDIFVIKYNTTGSFQWAKSIGGTYDDEAKDLAVDQYGNVYLAAYSKSISMQFYSHEIKWLISFEKWEPIRGDYNAYKFPTKESISIPAKIYLIKLDSNGTHTLVKNYYTNSNVISLAVDNYENIYMAGDNLVIKYNAVGIPQWRKKITQSASMGVTGFSINSIAVDAAGYSYICGTFYKYDNESFSLDFGNNVTASIQSPGYEEDLFIAQYDDNGQALWASRYGISGEDQGMDLTVNQEGSIYLVGQSKIYTSVLDFGNNVQLTPVYIDLMHNDGTEEDVFLVKFSSQNTTSSFFITDQYYDQGFNAVSINLNENFEKDPLPILDFSASSEDEQVATVFLEDAHLIIQEKGVGTTIITITAKYEKGEVIKTQFKVTISNKKQVKKATFSSYTEEITAYPNPVVNELKVAVNSEFTGDVSLQLFNTKGDVVQAFTVPKTNNTTQYKLDMQNMPDGLYLLKIIEGDIHTVKKIVK